MSDEKPFPPDTKCVVTWHDMCPEAIGLVVTTGEPTIVRHHMHVDERVSRVGMLQQQIAADDYPDRVGMHPVKWLRPLEDPDSKTIELDARVPEET